MEVYKLLNPVARENTYILCNEQALILVDPGSKGSAIIERIKTLKKPLAAILLTHTHYDHIMSLDLVRDSFGSPPVYVSEKEADWLGSPKDNLSGLDRHQDMADITARPAEHYFTYQIPYHIAGFHFTVVETPGHSAGGVSFIFPDDELVLTGDALFKETIGRTDLPTGDLETLISSIKQKLFTLPNHYKVYPGHGMNTTIAHEKNFNPFLQ
ncbi:MBL fold metallo-hydrolase [Streptococcus sp. H31]|uniref:MBL fold metallo-hydrolase n=1 Tax=Streptococcus huangxiaojuni TaxID=3237239 RepID=UPI0034A4B1F0